MDMIETDVLVVGCGAAGLMAALTASMHGARVVAINKGDSVNCTTWADRTYEIAGGGGCGFAAPVIPPDGPERYYEDLVRIAAGRNIPELTSLFAEKTVDALHYLVECGVRFKRTSEGRLLAVPEIWHSLPRILYSEHGTGREIVRLLKVRASSFGVRMLEGIHAFRLLALDGEIAGCLAFVKGKAEMVCFRCKSVILATGGAGRLFRYTTNPAGITGDGILLAKEVGAELVNMELYSHIPMSLKPLYGLGFVPKLIFAGVDAKVEELLRSPVIPWRYNPSKLSVAQFQKMFPKTFRQLQAAGVDLDTDVIELHWMPHFMLGGVRINRRGETSVRGLYAAGEVAGGVSGRGRLPGTGIAEGIVFGKIAGQSAALYARKSKCQRLDEKTLKKSCGRTEPLPDKKFQEMKEIRLALADLMHQALRAEKGAGIEAVARGFGEKEKEINTILGMEHTDFVPSFFQAETILEIKSALAFGKVFLEEGMLSPL